MIYHYKSLKLEVPKEVYFPREDSELLAGVLEKEIVEKGKMLEVGCGSGLLSIIAARRMKVTAVDVNPKAVEITIENAELNKVGLEAYVSDIFSTVRGRFELIVFNPPYLPDKDDLPGQETWSDTGQIERFVKDVKNHLIANGIVLMVISSLTDEERVKTLFSDVGMQVETVERKKVPWEELLVLRAKSI